MSETRYLDVTMFGRFRAAVDGALIAGQSAKFTQHDRLVSVLLYNLKDGASKNFLREEVLDNPEVENLSHCLQSVIYNSKRKINNVLKSDVAPIVSKKNKYYWNADIPLKVDVFEFEELLKEAKACEDEDTRYEKYHSACYLYKGEFLADFRTSVWAIGMGNYYRDLFSDAANEAVDYMRNHGLYLDMEKLGHYASEVDPLSDWETVTMEALVLQGRVADARAFYERTCDYYLNEQGLRPSEKLSEFLRELGNQFSHHTAVLDEVQEALSKTNSTAVGGYVCAYPVFEGIYHIMERMTARLGMSVYLMLCTVVDGKGNPMKEGPNLVELSERLFNAICISVRQSDVINKYGKGQFLILLTNVSRENCGIIQKRINNNFRTGRRRTDVQYFIKSVIYTSEEAEQEQLLRREDSPE